MHTMMCSARRTWDRLKHSPRLHEMLYIAPHRALHPCWGRPFMVRVYVVDVTWVRLWFELTHDAMTRKIRAGSDLRHDVRYIYYTRTIKPHSTQERSKEILTIPSSSLLGECRTLWGERERVHAGAEFAWNSCMTLCWMCMEQLHVHVIRMWVWRGA